MERFAASAKIDAVDVGTKIYADPLAPSDARTTANRVSVFSVVSLHPLPAPLESRKTHLGPLYSDTSCPPLA
jgi:hypothetical protein